MATIVNVNTSEKPRSYSYNILFANKINVLIYLGTIVHIIMAIVAIYFSFKCTPRFDPLHFTAAFFLPPFYIIYILVFKLNQCQFISEKSRSIQPDTRISSFGDYLKYSAKKTPQSTSLTSPEIKPKTITPTPSLSEKQSPTQSGNKSSTQNSSPKPKTEFKSKLDENLDLFDKDTKTDTKPDLKTDTNKPVNDEDFETFDPKTMSKDQPPNTSTSASTSTTTPTTTTTTTTTGSTK